MTEFYLNVQLKKDIPHDIVNILLYMLKNDECYGMTPEPKLPDHPFFKTSNWEFIFYHDFISEEQSFLTLENVCFLHVYGNFKNYDNEIHLFIDWISPYLIKVWYPIGWYKSEQTDQYIEIYQNWSD